MTPSELFVATQASVANILILRGAQRVSSGTGFLVNGKLVTCGHVLQVPTECRVLVRFEKAQGQQSPEWAYAPGMPPLAAFSAEQSFDYAVLAPPQGVQPGPNLTFAADLPEPGRTICTLGYPFEDPHLTIHQGLVSAVYASGVATMLKLDMSVNPSNSGGPLMCLETGQVLGVVARKATGLTQAFAQLMQSYQDNINALQGAVGMIGLGNVDPVAALLAGQHQMRAVSTEIQRSANVGIGYAIWCQPLREEAALTS